MTAEDKLARLRADKRQLIRLLAVATLEEFQLEYEVENGSQRPVDELAEFWMFDVDTTDLARAIGAEVVKEAGEQIQVLAEGRAYKIT